MITEAGHVRIAKARRQLLEAQDRLDELLHNMCPGPHSRTPNFCQACGYSETGIPRQSATVGSRWD